MQFRHHRGDLAGQSAASARREHEVPSSLRETCAVKSYFEQKEVGRKAEFKILSRKRAGQEHRAALRRCMNPKQLQKQAALLNIQRASNLREAADARPQDCSCAPALLKSKKVQGVDKVKEEQ